MWPETARLARKAKVRQAAIAYVTTETVTFGKGDFLIVDASPRAIGCGETTASVLLAARRRGASIYSCDNLHAKVLVLDGQAVIGSANLSQTSAGTLRECAVLTRDPALVGEARSYLQQLKESSNLLTEAELKALTLLPVVRTGGRGHGQQGARRRPTPVLGRRRWMLGTTPLNEKTLSADDTRVHERALNRLAAKLEKDRDDLEFIRLRGTNMMRRAARVGDRFIDVHGSGSQTNRLHVQPPCAILAREDSQDSTFFYYDAEEAERKQKLGKTSFLTLLQEAGSRITPTPRMTREISLALFEKLELRWPK